MRRLIANARIPRPFANRMRGHWWGRALLATIATAATAALVLTPGAASARSTDWTLWQAPVGAQYPCGNTWVTLDFPVNREYVRDLPPEPGTTVLLQVTGSLTVRFSTPDKAVTYNVGGPGTLAIYPDGSVLVRSEGHYSMPLYPSAAATFGYPLISTSTGLIEYRLLADGTFVPSRLPHHVIDVCAALGL